MRAALLLVTVTLLGAGCLAGGGTIGPSPGGAPGGADDAPLDGLAADRDEPQFCDSASECDFWDEDYHEYVVYDVDSLVLDVLIVPSASADAVADTAVIKAAVDAWEAGVQELGQSWLADGFALNAYVLGQDTPPAEALEDPEIIVLAAEYNPFVLLGIGLEPKQVACSLFGEEAVREYPVHRHGGMEVRAADCTGMGFLCVAANTNFLTGNGIWLQDLVAHEVGHCLGGGHVGDALDFKAKRVPVHDVMSYQHDEDQVHCVSTLNVRVLEGLYAHLVPSVTVPTPLSAGDYYAMPKSQYSQVDCANP